MQRIALAAAVAAVVVAPLAEARITRIEITSVERPTFGGTTFGAVGAYEKLRGKAYGEVEPADSQNAVITDIELAPRAGGKVQYSMDLGDDWLRYMGPGEDTMATDPDYADFTRYAAFKRFSVETHVGNLEAILAGFEAGNAVHPIAGLTWSIAHPNNGEPADSQLARAADLGIGFTLTFSSVRNGQTGARFRSTSEKKGLRMCLASNAMNVAPYAPFQNLFYVTTGKTLLPGVSGVPEGERLTREQALRHATVECAWFLGQEGRLGSLEVGKHADLIVLSDDYFSVRDEAIKDITSVLTIVGGRIVHAEAEFTGLIRP